MQFVMLNLVFLATIPVYTVLAQTTQPATRFPGIPTGTIGNLPGVFPVSSPFPFPQLPTIIPGTPQVVPSSPPFQPVRPPPLGLPPVKPKPASPVPAPSPLPPVRPTPSPPVVRPTPPPSGPSPGIAGAVNTLGFNILKELRKKKPNTNVVFSPLSISAAFSLVYFGAKGLTRTEMESVFGFQGGVVPGQLKSKAGEFGEGSSQIANIANRAYINQGFQVLEAYRQAVGDSNFRVLNFANSQASKEEINSWVSTVTQGLINDLIPDGFITALTRLVLVNAVYFKGMWENAFPKDQTRPGEFRGTSGTITTDLMQLTNQRFPTKVIPGLSSRVIELPYKGDRFSMFIVLPNSDNGFTEVESKLADFGTSLFTGLSSAKFDVVKIPKWSFEQTQDELKKFLQTLGLRVAFTNQADLSGISTSEQLSVSDVVHKAKIIVDEEGTEAAAATAIGVVATSAVINPQRLLFIADHPFVYFIVDKNDNTVFFQGTVTSP